MKMSNPLLSVVVLALLGGPASASLMQFEATLNGLSEAPPNASPGTGFAMVDYDDVAHTLRVRVSFSGLVGVTTAAHIHAATAVPGVGTAGVATTTPTFAGFPLNVTSGSYDNLLDLTLASSFNPSFITAHGGTPATTEGFLAASLVAGTSYLNIHTRAIGGGEIRGFLVQVPEASTVASGLFLSLGALYGFARQRRVQATP